MKRSMLASVVLAVLVVSNFACNRNPASTSTSEPAAPAVQNAPAAAPATKSLAPKDLITDDKIGRYIIYQKEANTVASLAMGAAGSAYTKSGGSQAGFEKELAGDERTKKIADTQASALAKSGLAQMEAVEITKIVTPYVAHATIGSESMKKQANDEFSAKYGPEALAVMQKHLPELEKLQDEMLGAALGKKN